MVPLEGGEVGEAVIATCDRFGCFAWAMPMLFWEVDAIVDLVDLFFGVSWAWHFWPRRLHVQLSTIEAEALAICLAGHSLFK